MIDPRLYSRVCPYGMNVYGEYHRGELWTQLAHCWKR